MSTVRSQGIPGKWRTVLSGIGLGTAIAVALLWVGLHAVWIGGFQPVLGVAWIRHNPETTIPILDFNTRGFRPVLFWWRVGVWSSVLALVASSFGAGRIRRWGLIAAVATLVLWMFRGHS